MHLKINIETLTMNTNLKFLIKEELIEYFEDVISRCDLAAQAIFLSGHNDESLHNTHQEIVSNIKDTLEICMSDINKKQNVVYKSFEKLKYNLISRHCFYVENVHDHRSYPLGILVVADWYFDKNEMEFLRLVIFVEFFLLKDRSSN